MHLVRAPPRSLGSKLLSLHLTPFTGYEEHLGADKHWRALYPDYTGEGVVIEDIRDKVWNTMKIQNGWVSWLTSSVSVRS